MDEKLLKDVQNYVAFKKDLNGRALSDSECDEQAEGQLKKLLSARPEDYEQTEFEQFKAEVCSFMDGDEVQRRKLLAYCFEFTDPTEKKKSPDNTVKEETMLNVFLNEDKLSKLLQFIKKHKKDSSFGMTVYNIMEKYGKSAPQVYRAAMMRRQDFSRATDPKEKNVTRLIAWQIIIGLHCSLEEADEVLFSAGYVRRRNTFDLTMTYFIENKNYDIMAINEVLFALGLKLFSCYKTVKDSDSY